MWSRFHYVRAIFLYINSEIQKKNTLKKINGLCLVFSFSHIAQMWPSFKYCYTTCNISSSGSKKASWGALFFTIMNEYILLLCFSSIMFCSFVHPMQWICIIVVHTLTFTCQCGSDSFITYGRFCLDIICILYLTEQVTE